MMLTSAKATFYVLCVLLLAWSAPRIPALLAPKEGLGAVGGWMTLLPLAGAVLLVLFTLGVAVLVYFTESVVWTVVATVVLACAGAFFGFLMLLADTPGKG
ncbi:MAG: hypothetical protein JST93_27425 [Acidobacteria bacterium]|nr:hypothetical protein [Acidobacteriota bacterium]